MPVLTKIHLADAKNGTDECKSSSEASFSFSTVDVDTLSSLFEQNIHPNLKAICRRERAVESWNHRFRLREMNQMMPNQ
jgi:hypothetical protein